MSVAESTNQEREKILNRIRELYLTEGFYKTSMDSVAARLRISKKTIYKYFPSKEKLIHEVVFGLMQEISPRIDAIIKNKSDALTKIYSLLEILGSTFLKFSDQWLTDLKIHTPQLWKQIDEFRTKKLFSVMSALIMQGQNEGLIANLPAEIMLSVLVASVKSIINSDFPYRNKFTYTEAVKVTFDIFFEGVLTSAGRKKFNTIKKVK